MLRNRNNVKLGLFIFASLLIIIAIWYSNNLVKQLSHQERAKVELWAKTLNEIVSTKGEISPTLEEIIEGNKTIPVMLVDEEGNILNHINLHPRKTKKEAYLRKQLQIMKEQNPPIIINFLNHKNFVYYKESVLLTKLFYYPFIQIGVVILFIIVSYIAFNVSRKAEENQVWVGMSKETAHQLGTPISSLIAWVEYLKMKGDNSKLLVEVEKDVKRLETITERFSRIGSEPTLMKQDLTQILINSIEYLKLRTSKRVIYKSNFNLNEEIIIPLNKALFEWVIENLCKNAIDAMEGQGEISITIDEGKDNVFIDISDTGKGIPKSKQKTVFNAGFTTKKRGWGLGLSLAKRIVEIYHSGKIFIKYSEIDNGTTFRIILNK